jgi:hypothetical protein
MSLMVRQASTSTQSSVPGGHRQVQMRLPSEGAYHDQIRWIRGCANLYCTKGRLVGEPGTPPVRQGTDTGVSVSVRSIDEV